MSKMIEDLKAAGWVETTLGECQVGEEVLLTPDGRFPRGTRVTQTAEWIEDKGPFVSTSAGSVRRDTTPVLRAPRPEYEPGTVALITWDEGDEHVRDLLPIRAMMSVEGVWHGSEMDPPGESDRVEVVRVLLPADQDTPTVEVTDEMVERAAEAFYHGRDGEPRFGPQWDAICAGWPEIANIYRRGVRAALKAALGGDES